jgi:threonine dehydrogenase-like Zn-dependent dehydrogenase
MKALILTKEIWETRDGFQLKEVKNPTLLDNDHDKAILKVVYAGVCGSVIKLACHHVLMVFGPHLQNTIQE